MIKPILISFFSLLCQLQINAQQEAFNVETIFTTIYDKALWGKNSAGKGYSGMGSVPENCKPYMHYLQSFLKDKAITSVVDIGCGDWLFSQYIDWTGVNYIGFDVVESIIEQNKKSFASSNINFIHANIISTNLPKADLLIAKDVLQHLSNENIWLILQKIKNYKYCLFINDIEPKVDKTINKDVKNGGYRYLDLTQDPFFIKGEKVLQYARKSGCRTEVLLITNN